MISMTLIQLILLGRLLVVAICHVHANRPACIYGFACMKFNVEFPHQVVNFPLAHTQGSEDLAALSLTKFTMDQVSKQFIK